MDINEIKNTWNQAQGASKDQTELRKMTKISNHPKLKRMRIKLIIEVVLLTAFLLVYYDGFDGGEKPLWANILLIGAIIAYILNDLVNLQTLSNLVKGEQIADSLAGFYASLRRIRISSLLVTLLFGVALFSFFLVGIEFTTTKYLILGGMTGTLGVFLYAENRVWTHWIGKIRQTLEDFEEE